MAQIENATKDAVKSEDVIARIAEDVPVSDQLTKPTAVFVRVQV